MKTAGVIFDYYDDIGDSLVKEAKASLESADELPKVLGDFHFLTPEEREVLRDEGYALVMQNEGKVMRKFACVDEGNTVLSVLYFMHNWDKLPTEAVKVAAANLEGWCGEYGIPTPLFLKIAAKNGMSRKRDSAKQPAPSDDAEWNQRTNLTSVQGGADSGRVIPTASQMKTAAVGVSGHDVPVSVKRASARTTALGGKYPLDSMADVQKAIEYFNESYKQMDPLEAHVFAVKTASRAEVLGLPVGDVMERYGSKTYAKDVDAHLANRLASCAPEYTEIYEELREKRASIAPIDFAMLLTDADEVSGLKWSWGGDVSDPFFATFGKNKTASAWSWQSRTGDFVSEEEIRWLAKNGKPLVQKHFADDLVNGFLKDPLTVFDSLPDDSKVILARLASGQFDGMAAN